MATDEELVVRYLGGERRALAEIYERYADRVHDLCVAMLGAHDDADDAFQDTFLVACRRMEGLRDPTRLRPWLYSIARNQCRSRIRSRRRTRPVDQAGATIGVEVDMTARVARDELSRLVSDARAGLNERDQEVLDLHLRHGLEGDDLAAVLGVSTTNAYKLVQRVRDRVERSLGALLVARHGREDCAELDAILRGWDGRFSPLMRKRVARHIDDCPVCERRRRGLLAPGGIASALPFVAAPAALHDAVLHRLGTADSSPPPPPPSREPASWDDSGFPRPEHGGGPTRRLTWWVALAVLVLTAAGIGALGARSLSPDESRSTVSTGSGSPATDADTPATTDAVHETDEIAAPAAPTTTPPTTPTTTTPTTTTPTTTTPTTTPTTTTPTTTTPTTTTPTTTTPTTTTPTTTTPTTTTTVPVDATPPTITNTSTDRGRIGEIGCAIPNSAVLSATVTDTGSGVSSVSITFTIGGTGQEVSLSDQGGGLWSGTFGPFAAGTVGPNGEDVVITFKAIDGASNASTTPLGPRPITVSSFPSGC